MFGHEAKLAALINKDPPQLPNEPELVAALRLKLGPGADPAKLLFQIRSARGKTHWAVNSYLRDVMSGRPAPGHEDFQPTRPARAAAAAAAAAAATAASAAAAAAVSSPAAAAAAAPVLTRFPQGVQDGGSQPGGASGTGCGCGRCGNGGGGPAPATAADGDNAGSSTMRIDGAAGSGAYGSDGDSGSGGSAVPCGPGLDSLPQSLLEAVLRWLDYRSLASVALVCRATAAAAASDALWAGLFAARWGSVQFPVEPEAAGRAAGGGGGGAAGQAGGVGAAGLAPMTAAAAIGALGPSGAAERPPRMLHPRSHTAAYGGAAGGGGGQAAATEAAADGTAAAAPQSGKGAASGHAAMQGGGEAAANMGHCNGTPPQCRHVRMASVPCDSGGADAAAAAAAAAASAPAAGPSEAVGDSDGRTGGGLPGDGSTGHGPSRSDANGALAASGRGGGGGGANGGAARRRYAAQISYLTSLRCPRCGAGPLVPIVYGFPSPALMEGMRSRRLLLGGDHLIEDCHVWACNHCAASFRAFPYDGCGGWIADLARPAPARRPGELPPYTYEL